MKVGLRNYLFIGHPKAGWRSAVIYSVIGTCRILDVNPEEYLTWVLPKLAAATNMNATGLLPHDFKKLFLQRNC
jgi:transposase